MKTEKIKLLLVIIILILAGISPNLFPLAQSGYKSLYFLGTRILIPSILIMGVIILIIFSQTYRDLSTQIKSGFIAGIAATLALEIVRVTGFKMGMMPGDMPKLMGVLITDRFAQGPGFWSNVAGWSYHFWNGITFGLIYSLIFGRGRIWLALLYAILIGTGFMVSPATTTTGIGAFGLQFKDGYQFLTIVILAHLAFGTVMGWIILRKNVGVPHIFTRIKRAF